MINRFSYSLSLLLVFSLCAVLRVHAAVNPLGLTPGVATNITLGSIVNLSAYNTTLNNGDITYSNNDLATRQYTVRLPSGFDPNDATKKYGLVTFIDANDVSSMRSGWAAGLDANNVIYLAAQGVGNPQYTTYRFGRTIMGAFRMCELYNIDPNRIYVSGFSGGAFSASALAFLRSDWYHGAFPWAGSMIAQPIPGVMDVVFPTNAKPAVAMPTYFRTAEMTHYGDFNRDKATYVYRYARLNFGGNAREIMRPGGHQADDTGGESCSDALSFMYHPLVDIIWDRFEGGLLAGNAQPGKILAGTGWSAISGSVSEAPYSYNGQTLGVLWLQGDGASVRSNDTFTWQNNYGILADARLRAETAAGQNQQIGLHIVPASFTSGTAANQPGFHVYWCYGQPYRAELVAANGTHKTLATWQFTATHPMNLPSSDTTFWDSTAAPDYAGRMLAFRGEDVRLHLSSVGFQLTFNRPVSAMTTTYTSGTDGGIQACPDMKPMLIQGFWNDVETSLVSALPSGSWTIVLTNDAIVSGQPTGNAVVDEIHLVGSTGIHAAPAPVTVTASPSNRVFSWGQIGGAMGYVVQRADSPDGPFTTLTTLSNTAGSYSDTTATQTRAYYYRVAAIGSDGATGHYSDIGFAALSSLQPGAPLFLGCTALTTSQAQLVWLDTANNETGDRVERSPSGMGQWTLVSGTLPANTITFTDTGLAASTAYDYRVSAVGLYGISSYATLTLTTPSATPGTVTVPMGLSATQVANNSVALSWGVATGSAYNVKRGTSVSGPFTTIAAGITATSYTDPLLLPGTYYYVVSNVSGPAESADFTPPASITVMNTIPPVLSVPSLINVLGTSASGATVTFAPTATDVAGNSCAVTCVPASGSTFASGTTVVTATATDSYGISASNTFSVVVQPFGSTTPAGYWNANASGLWSSNANWSGGIIPGVATKIGAAYFDQVNLTTDCTVYLDQSVAVSTLSFGDTDPTSSASWTISNNGVAGNAVSFYGTTPTVNVNALGTGAKATINANVYSTTGLTKTGAGQLVLPLPAYTGNTTVSGGTLTLQGAYGSSAFNLASGATLEIYVNGVTQDSPSTVFSGSGTLLKTGTGSQQWGATVATFALGSGSTIDVEAGTFTGGSYGNEDWTANKSNLNVGPYGVFDGVESNVNVNALTGSGKIKSGFSGSGYSTFTFGVDGGNGTFTGVLADSTSTGSFTKAGNGTQVLTGVNTYSGNTTVSAGTLQIGDGTTNASIANSTAITANGTLVFNNLLSKTYSAPIAGTGNLVKAGAGTLALTGNNTYTGNITVTGGTLQFAKGGIIISLNASKTNVQNGGTLVINVGGTGEFSAANVTTLLTNLTVSSSSSSGMNAGSALGFDTTNAAGGSFTIADSITDTTGTSGGARGLAKFGVNTLVLSGANSYTGPTTVNAGTLQFAKTQSLYGGNASSWTASNLNVQSGGTLAINVGGTGEFATTDVTTLLANLVASTSYTSGMNSGALFGFDTTNAAGGTFTIADSITDTTDNNGGTRGLVKLGTNTLVLGGNNTYSGSTLVKQGNLTVINPLALQNSTVDTSGTGTITVSGITSLTLGGITGNTSLSSVFSGYNNLTSLTLNLAAGVTSTYSGAIANGSGNLTLTETGSGTLVLTGNNTYPGPTIINGGTLQLGNGTSGRDGVLATSSITNNGNLDYNLAGNQTLSTTVTGTGSLTKDGNGTLTIAVSNLNPSSITINAGTLQIGTGAGSTTSLGSSGSYAGAITLGSSGTFNFKANSATQTLSGPISGAGGLSLNGGTLILTGNNTYTGATFSVGTLKLGSSNALGNTSSLSFSGGTFNTASATPVTLATNMPIAFNWNTSFTGTANLDMGTGNVSMAMGSGMQYGGLVVNGSGSVLTLGGVISGDTSHAFLKTGVGTLSLTNNASTITSPVIVGGGTLRVVSLANGNSTSSVGASSNAADNLRLGSGGTLQYVGATTSTNRNFAILPGGGTIDSSGTGALNFTNTAIISPDVATQTGNLTTGNATVTGLANNKVLWLGMPVSGTGIANGTTIGNATTSLTGTTGLVLTQNATATGNQTLTFGYGARTLTLTGNNTGNNTIAGILQDGATVGGVAGTLSLTKSGIGTWVLSGNNTYTGNTTISAGTLQLGDGTTDGLIANTGSITNNGTLVFNLVGSQTLSKAIRGTGNLTKSGPGTLILSGANTYAGGTTIANGVLAISSASLSANASVNIATGSVLNLNFAGTNAVTSFQINGIAQSAGNWGGLASLATYKTQLITGSGILNVTSGPASQPYTSWAAFYSNIDTTPASCPSGDGIPNLVKYALGLNPTLVAANPVTMSQVVVNGSTYLQLSVNRNSAVANVTIDGLSTGTLTDPNSWSTGTTVIVTNTPSVFTVRDSLPIESNSKRFLKLRFTLQP